MLGARVAALALLWTCAGCGRLGFDPAPDAATIEDAGEDAARDGGPDTGCAAAASSCTSIPSLAAPPVLDGELEPCLALTPVTPEGWTGSVAMPDVRAQAAYAWRPDGLYVFVWVGDRDLHPAAAPDEPFCGDGVEIYVDDDATYAVEGAYDVPGTVQLIVAAPATTTGTSRYAASYAMTATGTPWPSDRFAMVGRPDGYAFEALIQAEDLGRARWTPSAGARVGIDLSINVSTPDGRRDAGGPNCGVRLGQFFLRVVPAAGSLCGQPFCDTRAFCDPRLN